MGDPSSASFLKKQWNDFKEYYVAHFAYSDVYSRFIGREEPLPSWSHSDINEFIASDPLHGPNLKTTREAANMAFAGSAIGAISTAAFCWKHSRSLHGAGLAFVGGAVVGWTCGQEVATHWYQLYKLDTMSAQDKFLVWWENKSQRRS